MTNGPIRIDTSASASRPDKRRRWLFWMAVGVGFITLAGLLGVLVSAVTKRNVKLTSQTAQRQPSTVQVADVDAAVDESQLQWVSPTSGSPMTLDYVPPGTQVILHLRPAELLAHDEGEKILDAFGPWGLWAVGQIEERTDAKLAEIDSLLVAVHRGDDGWDCTLRATFAEPRSRAPADVVGCDAFLPPAGQGRVLVACPREMTDELKHRGDAPALIARDMQRLLPLADGDRSATLLMLRKFVDTEGRELFLDGGETLVAAFDTLVPENASAVLISLDWREHFFWELAATTVQNIPARRFHAKCAEQLNNADLQVAASLASNPPHSYGMALEERFPAMLRTMSDHTRVSDNQGIAVVRCYLPVHAGHNLLLASRLRMSGLPLPADTQEPALSITQRLTQVTTLVFPKETLENTLEMLAADVQLPLRIAGGDLQLEGITKNQTFALNLRNRPVAEILVEVLRKANPDREATGPADPRQKLVYVVRGGVVIVTTRAAVARRGEELPEVFRVKEQ